MVNGQASWGGGSQWQNNGSAIYYVNGNVGIGTSNPLKQLHIVGSGLASRNFYVQSPINPGSIVGIGELQSAKHDWPGYTLYGIGWDSASGGVGVLIPPYSTFGIYGNGGPAHLLVTGNTILSNGGLCINNEGDFPGVYRRDCGGYWWMAMQRSSGNIGLVNGNAWLLSSGDYIKTSDARLKNNIVMVPNALDKLSRIRGVSFEWNELTKLNAGKKGLGVIAQEVEAVFPELVSVPSDDGYKSVNYEGLIAPLIEAIKELKAENESLKVRIEKLEKK